VDVVAHLIRKNLGMLSAEEESMLGDDFKLILFLAFQTAADSVGLELCQKFHDLCKAKGWKNFECRVRLSDQKSPRWNEEFITKEMTEIRPTKIWVSGPPMMNELFDKTLAKVGPSLSLDLKTDIDIM